jgi:oligopeptide transport system ATP-binding protein
MESVLLDIQRLKKFFFVQKDFFSGHTSPVKALNGLNISIYEGETLGLVGESGCGKSTLGRLISRLDNPTEGRLLFRNRDISGYSGKELQNYRKMVQIIFQDPYASLNPRRTAGRTIGEPFRIFKTHNGEKTKGQVRRLMKQVGLNEEHEGRYPHEFSGGQRQRIGIARALALNPQLIIADEPVSALDVSVQAQILNLMIDLQKQYNLTYLFISHDLGVVRHMSSRVAVMYLGKIVELSDKNDLYENPLHPYTTALLSAVPSHRRGTEQRRIILQGDLPSPLDLPSGCSFHPRCPSRMKMCDHIEPDLKNQKSGHAVACHLFDG